MERKSFLDYYKLILEKVSFDDLLFRKEYEKALQTIHPSEHSKLDQWMVSKGYSPQLKAWRELRQAG